MYDKHDVINESLVYTQLKQRVTYRPINRFPCTRNLLNFSSICIQYIVYTDIRCRSRWWSWIMHHLYVWQYACPKLNSINPFINRRIKTYVCVYQCFEVYLDKHVICIMLWKILQSFVQTKFIIPKRRIRHKSWPKLNMFSKMCVRACVRVGGRRCARASVCVYAKRSSLVLW